jgi:hypothetical protein
LNAPCSQTYTNTKRKKISENFNDEKIKTHLTSRGNFYHHSIYTFTYLDSTIASKERLKEKLSFEVLAVSLRVSIYITTLKIAGLRTTLFWKNLKREDRQCLTAVSVHIFKMELQNEEFENYKKDRG